jgi:hypothetical protein
MLYNQQWQQVKIGHGQQVPVWVREKLEPLPHNGHPYFRLDQRAKFKVK